MKQNITLRLDKNLIKKGKLVGARKDTSVSKMLSDQLRTLIEDEEQYHRGEAWCSASPEEGPSPGREGDVATRGPLCPIGFLSTGSKEIGGKILSLAHNGE